MTHRDLCALRDAADDAATEVLWHLEQDGEAPAYVLAHAESLMRAIGALTDEPAPQGGGRHGGAQG